MVIIPHLSGIGKNPALQPMLSSVSWLRLLVLWVRGVVHRLRHRRGRPRVEAQPSSTFLLVDPETDTRSVAVAALPAFPALDPLLHPRRHRSSHGHH